MLAKERLQTCACLWSSCSPVPVASHSFRAQYSHHSAVGQCCCPIEQRGVVTGRSQRTVPALTAYSANCLSHLSAWVPNQLRRTWDFSGRQGITPQEGNNWGFQVVLGEERGSGALSSVDSWYHWHPSVNANDSRGLQDADWLISFGLEQTGANGWLVWKKPILALKVQNCWVLPYRDLSVSKIGKSPNGRGDLDTSQGLYGHLQHSWPSTHHAMTWLWLDLRFKPWHLHQKDNGFKAFEPLFL